MKHFYLKFKKHNEGNALITLLFFMFIAITILSSMALVLSSSIFGASNTEQGQMAYYAAESGAENGLLYLLRNPSYTGTLPSMSVGSNSQASVTIDNNGIITSTGTFGNAVRKIEVDTASSSGALNVSAWKEVH